MVDRGEHQRAETWLCPERATDFALWNAATDRLQQAAQHLSDRVANVPAIYGLELRTAYLALRGTVPLTAVDTPYWREKTAFLYRRPAVEPIILSFWKRHASHLLDQASALQTVSLLTGRSARFREKAAVSRSLQGSVRFEPPEFIRSWLPAVADLQLGTPSKTDWPVYTYARTVMAHPFEDGNGRLARFLFAATLAAQLRVKRPCLSLAPSFYRYAEPLSGALTILSRTGDWQPLTAALIVVVEEAVVLTSLSGDDHKPDG